VTPSTVVVSVRVHDEKDVVTPSIDVELLVDTIVTLSLLLLD
jgi:hypothetical protein